MAARLLHKQKKLENTSDVDKWVRYAVKFNRFLKFCCDERKKLHEIVKKEKNYRECQIQKIRDILSRYLRSILLEFQIECLRTPKTDSGIFFELKYFSILSS